MSRFLLHIGTALRLHFRNTMALVYGFVFPVIFLLAFWMLYRYDRVPLVLRIAELLTIAILGGACFGLPTSLVSERERGVWRRYRLAPVSTGQLLVSTVVARYLLLLAAGLLQLGLAMAIGMPAPAHPVELWVAFTVVSMAFVGLGLVIATMADTVPAVQALGQCVFLPMLIIGGIAVPLEALPLWAQHVSAFFPGRYAVAAIEATVVGPGLSTEIFSVLALLVIGAAGSLVGVRMFRWDAQQRFARRRDKGWLAVALAAWLGVGAFAEGREAITKNSVVVTAMPPAQTAASAGVWAVEPPAGAHPPTATSGTTPITSAAAPASPIAFPSGPPAPPTPPPLETMPGAATLAAPPAPPLPAPARTSTIRAPARWQDVTRAYVEADLFFDQLPPDGGIVTPIAARSEQPDASVQQELEFLQDSLASWPPAQVGDLVQRTRNLLFVLAVPDILQVPIERFAPAVVFSVIRAQETEDDLLKALYWIAMHPHDGEGEAMWSLESLGIVGEPPSEADVRERASTYAVKLIGRMLGKISDR